MCLLGVEVSGRDIPRVVVALRVFNNKQTEN